MTSFADVIEQLRRSRPDGMYPGPVIDKPKKESIELSVWIDMRRTPYTGVEIKSGHVDPILRLDFEVAYQADFDHSRDWLWTALAQMRDGDLESCDIPGIRDVRLRG
jgi:hypothetical protein